MRLLYYENSWCWLAVALIAIVAVVGLRRTLRARRLFFDRGDTWRLWLKVGMRGLAALLAGIAALGPAWGDRTVESPPARGRDVLLLLDVSRSMLAEDAQPNRLERAKAEARRLGRELEQRGACRIGLI